MVRGDNGAAKWPMDEARPHRTVRVPSGSGALPVTARTLSATTTGVSDEEIRRQSERHKFNGTDPASSVSLCIANS